MKYLILVSLVLSSNFASAFPTAGEMAQNFQTCETSSPNWDQKWGKYVVSFDRFEVGQICNQIYVGRGISKLASCKVDGAILYAGYVCDELDGGAGHR